MWIDGKRSKGDPHRRSKGKRNCSMVKDWTSWDSSHSKKKPQAGRHCSILVLTGQLQREWSVSFHKDPYGEDKRQWVQIALGKTVFHIDGINIPSCIWCYHLYLIRWFLRIHIHVFFNGHMAGLAQCSKYRAVQEAVFLAWPGCGTDDNGSSSPSLCRAQAALQLGRGLEGWHGGTLRIPGTIWGSQPRMLLYGSTGNNSTDSLRKWLIFFSSLFQKPLSHAGGKQSYSRHRCWTSWVLQGWNNWVFAALSSQSPKINPLLRLSHSPVSDISVLAVRRKNRHTRPLGPLSL